MTLRGFHSKSSSSTARSTAATAPRTSPTCRRRAGHEQRLSLVLVRCKNWAMSDPTAPPVMMIGPSAPNGPPEPIEIADDSGLSSATLGSTRLPLMRIASMASGMP
jgi:hypothetical protein